MRRLNSISRSPVYNGFSEALEGCIAVRASGQQKRFAELNEEAVAVMQQTSIAGTPTRISSVYLLPRPAL